MEIDASDELPRVTPSMLRRVDDCCHRRLAGEHRGGKRYANKTADGRFAVSNRLTADVRLAHADDDVVRAEAFVDPYELEPEQRHVYRAAARGYLEVFGARPGRLADLGWRTTLPDLGVDLVGDVGVALEPADGPHELRILRVGGRRTGAPLLDPVVLRCALVRTAPWAGDELRIVAVDLLEQEVVEHVPDLDADRAEASDWIACRVDAVREHAAHGKPRAGSECNGCGFVAGCDAHG